MIPVALARRVLSPQAFDFIEERQDCPRPISTLREAFLGLVYPLLLLARELVARPPRFDPGSAFCDELGK
jgi:hypothetical protein